MFSVRKILKLTDGYLYSGTFKKRSDTFSCDTREIKENSIFVGIKGDNFDGNSFYKEAFRKGASIAILEESFTSSLNPDESETIIIVKNAYRALDELAKHRLKKNPPKVIAVTGSVGKTTTKDILYSVLRGVNKTLKTEKNYNNHLGVPLTLLRLKREKYAVVELGMSNSGEIEHLSKIVRPDVAIITNIHPVHIEHFDSVLDIEKAKLEIVKGFKKSSKLFLNSNYFDKDLLSSYSYIDLTRNEFFKIEKVDNKKIVLNIKGTLHAFPNKLNTISASENIIMAILVLLYLKIDIKKIKEGLDNLELTSGRLQEITTKKGIKIINDSYNASSSSMINSLEYISNFAGRKVVIFGDINELGTFAKDEHSLVGEKINDKNTTVLYTVGDNSFYIYECANVKNKTHFKTKEELYKNLDKELKPGDVVLVKASNGNKFIEIVNYIEEIK